MHGRNFWKAFWLAPHTPSRVAPSDPRWRAATVGGFIFGGSDPPYRILAVQAEKDGITTIFGELMGKRLSIPHIVVNISPPPLYCNPQNLIIKEVEEGLLVDLAHRVLRDLRHHAHLVRYQLGI